MKAQGRTVSGACIIRTSVVLFLTRTESSRDREGKVDLCDRVKSGDKFPGDPPGGRGVTPRSDLGRRSRTNPIPSCLVHGSLFIVRVVGASGARHGSHPPRRRPYGQEG